MKLLCCLLCFAAVVILLLFEVSRAEEQKDIVDEKVLGQLQGHWDPISSVLDGKENRVDKDNKFSFVIDGRYMSVQLQDKVVGKLEIVHLVVKDSLGQIDFEVREPRPPENVRAKQLFKLEGDKLTTCVTSPPGGERPTELSSAVGSKRLLTVSERRKSK